MKFYKLFLFVGFLTLVGCAGEEEAAEGDDNGEEENGVDYPSETIEVVVPAGPGGDTDINVRTLSEYLQDELDEDIVVTNVEGAGGTTGSSEVYNAEPDGHTVLFFHNGFLVNEILGLADYGYEDFELAGNAVLDEGNGFFVDADSQFEDIQDLVEFGQENPGEATVATEVGSFTHVQLLALEDETGADFNIVDVGGAADKNAALLGGQIEVNPTQYGLVEEYIESGDFRNLGILAEEPVDLMPEEETFIEQDVDISFEKFYFYAFPPDTPEEVVETFSEAIESVVEENDEYRNEAEEFYVTPEYLDPDETYEMMDDSAEYYEELLEDVDDVEQ